jgi:diadenosine tetraphosphatase ApaH/serine/threonine PP2A family protein phosphatase
VLVHHVRHKFEGPKERAAGGASATSSTSTTREVRVVDESESACGYSFSKPGQALMPAASTTTTGRNDIESKHSHHVMGGGKIKRRILHVSSNLSLTSADFLNSLLTPRETVPDRVITNLEAPHAHGAYFASKAFMRDMSWLCEHARVILKQEPRCLQLQSPAFVYGDIHGNLDDLHFFSSTTWPNGIALTPGKFVFLGDYVDRGMKGLECAAYLFALKIKCPSKVFLLRGNHELRDTNGWEACYGDGCFLTQCKARFGKDDGAYLWETVNSVFDCLPIACILDQDIFCVHGGIPPPSNGVGRLERISQIPNETAVALSDLKSSSELQIAYQCLWSDPSAYEEESILPPDGFGKSARGSNARVFGQSAVDDFLAENDFSFIIRAHQKTTGGVSFSKNARVLTVFSTSSDHELGDDALAACLLVDDARIQVITKDPLWSRGDLAASRELDLSSPAGAKCEMHTVHEAKQDRDTEAQRRVDCDGRKGKLQHCTSMDSRSFFKLRRMSMAEYDDDDDADYGDDRESFIQMLTGKILW